jgi:hypothetical protein
MPVRRHVFVDVEASAPLRLGYPIEVGLAAGGADGFVGLGGMLIRPPMRWAKGLRWMAEAQAVHGIDQATLEREGRDPGEAARWLNGILGDGTAYSDAPRFDGPWLEMIHAISGVPATYSVKDVAVAFAETSELGYHTAEKARRRWGDKPHRAEADALLWARMMSIALGHEGPPAP